MWLHINESLRATSKPRRAILIQQLQKCVSYTCMSLVCAWTVHTCEQKSRASALNLSVYFSLSSSTLCSTSSLVILSLRCRKGHCRETPTHSYSASFNYLMITPLHVSSHTQHSLAPTSRAGRYSDGYWPPQVTCSLQFQHVLALIGPLECAQLVQGHWFVHGLWHNVQIITHTPNVGPYHHHLVEYCPVSCPWDGE